MTITKTSDKNILTQLSSNDEIVAPLWLIFRHDPALSVYPEHGHAWGEFIYAFNGVICIVLLALGLWNATMALSEKGFYIMAFLLSLFGAVAVQKNIRDLEYLRTNSQPELPQPHPVQQVEVKELETPEDKF